MATVVPMSESRTMTAIQEGVFFAILFLVCSRVEDIVSSGTLSVIPKKSRWIMRQILSFSFSLKVVCLSDAFFLAIVRLDVSAMQ